MNKLEAWKAYKEAVAAQEAYDEAIEQAWKAYDEAVAQAWEAYDGAVAQAWKAHKAYEEAQKERT